MQNKKTNKKNNTDKDNAITRNDIANLTTDIIAAATTPFIIFISTTNSLYLGNQEDLAYQVNVLYPFLTLFAVTWFAGCLLIRLTGITQNKFFKFFFWAYMMVGPFFLVYASLHVRYTERMDTLSYYGGTIILYILTTLFFSTKGKIVTAKKAFATVAIIFFILEGYQFIKQVENDHPLKGREREAAVDAKNVKNSNNSEMPNIYHIVFDAYQTELLEQTLTSQFKNKLTGFRLFSETSTPFGLTRMALAATFLGKPYDYDTPQIDYQRDAYNSEQSFLSPLIDAGYETFAIVHPVHAFKQNLFQQVVPLKKYADIDFRQDNSFLFRNLWLYARLPKRLAALIVPSEDIVQLEKKNLLPDVAPIYSYSAFQTFLSEEDQKASHNRYTFMHLIIPHFPYVLRADGTFAPPIENGDIPKTSRIEQVRCVANMIISLIDRLKALDRFDDSLIIIHGDHGSGHSLKKAELAELNGLYSPEWQKARSRPVLLLKLPHNVDAGEQLQVHEEEVTLFDIAPTILDSLKISAQPGRYSGFSLARSDLPKKRGKRCYHYFKKKGWHGWTDTMERYVIENGEIRKDKDIQLSNNPKIHPEDFTK